MRLLMIKFWNTGFIKNIWLCARSGTSSNPANRQIAWSCGGCERPDQDFFIFLFLKKNDFSWFFNDSSTVFVVNHSHRDLSSLSLSTECRYCVLKWYFGSPTLQVLHLSSKHTYSPCIPLSIRVCKCVIEGKRGGHSWYHSFASLIHDVIYQSF